MEKDTYREHFIPRFYLRYFSENDKMIYQYDVKANDHISKYIPIKSICYIDYLYEFKNISGEIRLSNLIEKNLGALETKMSIAFNSIRDSLEKSSYSDINVNEIDSECCDWIRIFVATTLLRNPVFLSKATSELVKKTDFNYSEEQAKCLALFQCLPVFRKIQTEEETNNLLNLIKKLLSLSCVFFVNEKDVFWTSDRPVLMCQKGKNISEVNFSLSSKILVHMIPTKDVGFSSRIERANNNCIMEFNRLIYNNCRRWVYSRKPLYYDQIKSINKTV